MRTVIRVALLFVAYGTVGFGGDYLVGLLAADDTGPRVDPRIEVELQREIEVDVQVRTGGECAFTIDREQRLSASVGDLLEIDAGSGGLRVEGREGLDEVVALGRVCASREEYVDELRVTMVREGAAIVLSAHYPDRAGFDGRGNTARIDLVVSVPMGLDVDIDDSSGDIEVSGVGDLDIDDSSGSIRVAGAAGSVQIDDSSGGIEVSGVAGDVQIEDGSGGISVQGVAGAVSVRDGSGGIEVTDVARDVVIEADGSGGIAVSNVAGDFAVDRDGSGGISHSNIGGTVDIPERVRR